MIKRTIGVNFNKTRRQSEALVLEVAEKMFCELGFKDTQKKLISEEVGLNTVSISKYFRTKEDILAAIVERQLCEILWYRLNRPFKDGGNAKDFYQDVATGVLEYAQEKQTLLKVYQERTYFSDTLKQHYEQMLETFEIKVGEMLSSEGGSVIKSLQTASLKTVPRSFAYALAGYAWAIVEGKDLNIEEVASGLATIFTVGLHGTQHGSNNIDK